MQSSKNYPISNTAKAHNPNQRTEKNEQSQFGTDVNWFNSNSRTKRLFIHN